MAALGSVLATLRRPAHTGENRCWPCTALNTVIAGATAVVLAWLLAPAIGAETAAGLGLLGFALALVTIALRGYLVPGTPSLTQRYLPAWVRSAIHDEPGTDDGWESADGAADGPEHGTGERTDSDADEQDVLGGAPDPAPEAGVDPEAYLLEVDAIREGEADLELTEGFAARIDEELAPLRRDGVTDEALAALLSTTPETVEQVDRSTPAVRVESRIRRWPSEAALLGDLATHAALAEAAADWTALPLDQRLDVLRALRSFHEQCPGCGGALAPVEDEMDGCCTGQTVLIIACQDCEDKLLTLSGAAAAGGLH